jgi:hypothetical protein
MANQNPYAKKGMPEKLSVEIPGWRRRFGLIRGVILICFGVLAFAILSGPGDIDVIHDGDSTTYKPRMSFVAIYFFTSALLTSILTYFFWQARGIFRLFAFCLGAITVFLIVSIPTGQTHYARVTPEGFTIQLGAWYAPETQTVLFADLASIDVWKAPGDNVDRGVLLCIATGEEPNRISVPIYDLMEHAMPEILRRAEREGVAIGDEAQAIRFRD